MNVILHAPHTSTVIPEEYLSDYTSPEDAFDCANKMVDHGTGYIAEMLVSDELVKKDNALIFPYSRVFCDVERFDSEEEEMNKIGMGVLYTHSYKLIKIRDVKNPDRIKNYYNEHHRLLNERCKHELDKGEDLLFVDLHSFSNTPLPYELHKDLKRPDICIGIEDYHSNEKMINSIIYHIEKYGYTWSINEPFIGCLIPSDYYLKDLRIKGFMFEVNKDILYDIYREYELLSDIIKDLKNETKEILRIY